MIVLSLTNIQYMFYFLYPFFNGKQHPFKDGYISLEAIDDIACVGARSIKTCPYGALENLTAL